MAGKPAWIFATYRIKLCVKKERKNCERKKNSAKSQRHIQNILGNILGTAASKAHERPLLGILGDKFQCNLIAKSKIPNK